MVKRGAYHHGDLRRTLLEASLSLIEDGGVGAISLREVARKAGVSHSAPYYHFTDKGSLLVAIAVDGFTQLAQRMAAAQEQASDPLGRLAASGRAYVAFALESPAHFRVMFRPELVDPLQNPEVIGVSRRAFELLVKSVAECQNAGVARAGNPMPLVLTCWAAVHGVASLWLDGPLSQEHEGFGPDSHAVANVVTNTLMGLLSADAALSQRTSATRKPSPKSRTKR